MADEGQVPFAILVDISSSCNSKFIQVSYLTITVSWL